ncbi:MAG: hypothetical protein WBF87_02150, partial [Mesorhizobium sp.]
MTGDDSDERDGFLAEGPVPPLACTPPAKTGPGSREQKKAKPHYHGHRDRLRERARSVGADTLPDYELLELLLFRFVPLADTKPRAKALIDRFGSLAEVLGAPPQLL